MIATTSTNDVMAGFLVVGDLTEAFTGIPDMLRDIDIFAVELEWRKRAGKYGWQLSREPINHRKQITPVPPVPCRKVLRCQRKGMGLRIRKSLL